MENASKALIIAGAILLSIFIIGLGMIIFNNAKDAMSGENLDAEKVQAINSKYDSYLGTNIKGSNVKTLCNLVRDNNLTADGSDTFAIAINEKTEAADINTLKATFANGKAYTVTATYEGPSKTINTITITENK